MIKFYVDSLNLTWFSMELLFPFLLEQDIQRMIIMKVIVAITKLMLLNLIRFSAMSFVIMDSTSADSESVSAMDFNSLYLYWSSVFEFVSWKSTMFKCYRWIVLDGTEQTQVSKLDIVLVTTYTEKPGDVMGNTFASRHAAKHRGFAALCYQLLGIPKRVSLVLIPTICRRKFLCAILLPSHCLM